MATESWLETDENKTLLAICTRKTIKGYGIGGIVWGVDAALYASKTSGRNKVTVAP